MKDYSRFLRVYANIPKNLRDGIIAVVDEEPYTWNSSYIEILTGTEIGEKIYQQLIKTEVI
ncbi:hypothetical protein IJG27_01375 [Candidatus Saccharibacteria bacterium]|nr:hypothetical protein [Candidatus Saccharibacteria bacterium]